MSNQFYYFTILILMFISFRAEAEDYQYPDDPNQFIKLMEKKFPDDSTRLAETNVILFDIFHYNLTFGEGPFFDIVNEYLLHLIKKTKNQSYLVNYYYFKANICYYYAKIDSQIYYYHKTIEFGKKYNRNDFVLHSTISLGVQNLINEGKVFEHLTNFLKMGYDNVRQSNDLFAYAAGNWSMMEYHTLTTKNIDSIIYYERKAKNLLDKLPPERFALKNFGYYLLNMFKIQNYQIFGKHDTKEHRMIDSYLDNWKRILIDNHNRRLINNKYLHYFYLAKYYRSKNLLDSAESLLMIYLDERNIYQKESIMFTYSLLIDLIDVLKAKKDFKEAIEIEKLKEKVKNLKDDQNEDVNRLSSLLKLEKENYNQRLETERIRNYFTLIIAVIIVIFVLIIFFILYSRYKTIRKLNIKLDAANSTKNKLFRILSHDLNSPVNSTLILCEQIGLYNEKMSKDEIIKVSSMIYNSAENLKSILTTLLEWSKINLEGFKVEINEINIHDLVKEVIEDLNYLVSTKSIKIEINLEQNQIIRFGSDALRIILRNLISNSLKFSPENGVIKLEYLDNSIKITDGGTGFPDYIIKGSFVQTKSTGGTKNEKGLGLGLQIVMDIISIYGAEISFRNNENGNGEVFIKFSKIN